MIIKIASKVTVRNVPWREQLACIEAEADGEWVDEWLETPGAYRASADGPLVVDIGGSGDGGRTPAHNGISRAKVGGTGLRRYGQALTPKQASEAPQTSWDSEFAAAKKHASAVLAQLGNAR